MATILYAGPDGAIEETVPAERISDSGKVRGVRLKLEDESYLHIPDCRLYSIAESEEEGQVGSTRP